MIVRFSEAHVRPGLLAEFRDFIVEGTRGFASRDGFLGDEILASEDTATLIYISRWRDEAAVAAFAGPGWRDTPVTLPAEDRYLAGPLRVSHFAVASAAR